MRFVTIARALLVAIFLVAAGGCSSNHSTGTSNSSAPAGGSGSASATAPSSLSPADAMMAVMKKMLDAKSYRAKMVSKPEEGPEVVVTMEFVSPDRFHMVTDKFESISVGHDSFVKTGGAGWMKSPVDMSEMIKQFRDPKFAEELNSASGGDTVKLVGPDVLDGVPMLVYEYTTTREVMGAPRKAHSKTWVGAADGLPRKMEIDSVVNNKASKGLITYSDYGADIKIEPPIK